MIFGILSFYGGLYLLWDYSGWQIALAVALISAGITTEIRHYIEESKYDGEI